MDDYINIMRESLKKKSELLESIIEKNRAQYECVNKKEFDEVDWDAFNLLVTEKEILIDRINVMDEGFQNLYDRVKEQLEKNKESYKKEILEMQEIIKKLTDQGVEISTGEERNKVLIENLTTSRKKAIKTRRNSLKISQNYYQSMRNQYSDDLNMLDKKK